LRQHAEHLVQFGLGRRHTRNLLLAVFDGLLYGGCQLLETVCDLALLGARVVILGISLSAALALLIRIERVVLGEGDF
jgi:hypothetical protein